MSWLFGKYSGELIRRNASESLNINAPVGKWVEFKSGSSLSEWSGSLMKRFSIGMKPFEAR
jgi:hypothetical protein